MHGEVGPGFEPTEWGFEYGTSPCASSSCTKVAGGTAYGLKIRPVDLSVPGLEPGTKYYYRTFATNPLGTDLGPEHTFSTFPFIDLVKDSCENALARKQTRSAGLLDCRAYELASAGFTGGYDVDLRPGAGTGSVRRIPGRHGQGPLRGQGRWHPGYRQPDQPRPRPVCRRSRCRQRTLGHQIRRHSRRM